MNLLRGYKWFENKRVSGPEAWAILVVGVALLTAILMLFPVPHTKKSSNPESNVVSVTFNPTEGVTLVEKTVVEFVGLNAEPVTLAGKFTWDESGISFSSEDGYYYRDCHNIRTHKLLVKEDR